MEKQNKVLDPKFLLFIGIIAVSTAAILIRSALNEANPFVIAAYRLTISALLSCLLLAFTKRRKVKEVITKRQIIFLLASGSFLAIHFAVWIISLNMITVNSSVTLVTTTPLWVGLLSPVLLKEKAPPFFYIGMVFAVLGGVIIAVSGSNNPQLSSGSWISQPISLNKEQMLGYGLAIIGALMAAGYMMVGRKLRSEMDNFRYTAIVYSVAAFLLDLLVFFRGENLFTYSPQIFLIFLTMAIIPQMIGHTILNYSLEKLPATVVSMALLGEPIGSTILAALFLREIPTGLELVGSSLILFGIYLSVIPVRKKVNAA